MIEPKYTHYKKFTFDEFKNALVDVLGCKIDSKGHFIIKK